MNSMQSSILTERDIEPSDSAHEAALYENLIKARLQTITGFVEGLTTSTVNLLLAEKPSAREALQELVVKEAALRWIVRVATLSNGDVRARLWADIDKALQRFFAGRNRNHAVTGAGIDILELFAYQEIIIDQQDIGVRQ